MSYRDYVAEAFEEVRQQLRHRDSLGEAEGDADRSMADWLGMIAELAGRPPTPRFVQADREAAVIMCATLGIAALARLIDQQKRPS